ncbi:DUF2680 domain-containing protein [Salirhabdus salicampi]|uniref:DUF2680 domain-containing protein n=1 Tax=Salirhabdus salicampi TaxID=476102 RepID=UPI0020C25D62|nr:DUF2680 domain-containing protein [Salirhabdus salicampi]MCP8617895.1 YckD family protein [Salirhabdus salicampi]
MKKMFYVFIVALTCILPFSSMETTVNAEAEGEKGEKITLTAEQQKEMDQLYQELIAKHKEIIEKYKEYGVCSEEKAQKKMTRLDNYYEKLKVNGFVPNWDHDHWKKNKATY